MPYTRTNWVTNETALSAANMNNIEDGIEEALSKVETNTLKTLLRNTFYPVGSIYTAASASFNPNTAFGGTWSLIGKSLKPQWKTTGFTFNDNVATDGEFGCVTSGNTVEVRVQWKNKVAINDDTIRIGEIDLAELGINSGIHAVHGTAKCDSLNAVGLALLSFEGTKAFVAIYDWVTRATSYPTPTGQNCQLSIIFNASSPTGLNDSMCDKWFWKRTA